MELKMMRDKILNTPAGREMDMLIAVQVMGWVLTDVSAYSPTGSAWARNVHGDDDWLEYYSTDIAAAWKLVEKLCNETGCDVVRVCKRDPEIFAEWSCNFGRGFEAFGNTAPLAICRAALLVVLNQ
jgi:hypothetical protein